MTTKFRKIGLKKESPFSEIKSDSFIKQSLKDDLAG
jgi:hypothetical protein